MYAYGKVLNGDFLLTCPFRNSHNEKLIFILVLLPLMGWSQDVLEAVRKKIDAGSFAAAKQTSRNSLKQTLATKLLICYAVVPTWA